MYKILKGCSEIKEKLGVVYKTTTNNPHDLTTSPEETLEEMSKTHFKDDSLIQQQEEAPNIPNASHKTPDIPTISEILKDTYNQSKADKAVGDLEPYKAPGPDGIYPIMIQTPWIHIRDITLNIMRYSHQYKHTPKPWRESRAVFIPKPGKKDYHNTKSFRTITLSPVILKLQERLVYWHMLNFSQLDKLTNERQYGFRKGVSTETALHKIVNKIEKRFAKKGFALGTFLDIEGAFDNVSFTAIDKALKDSPLDSPTADWIAHMVSNRYVTISHKTATKRIRIRRGCPQGGVLSPFLWNLIIDDLLNYSAKEIPGYLQAFADDLFSLAEGNDIEVIRSRTQKTINTIEKWCATKGLNISALKTQIVMFTWNKNWALDKQIKVGGIPIALSNSAKILGVTLDSKLNFNEHIKNITNKATASLIQCRNAVAPTWGMSPKTCNWIYTSAIRPILTYSAVIWINAINKKHNIKKLAKVQRLALRMATGAMPSTSTESLNLISDIPNIVDYIQGEAAKSAYRLMSTKEWTNEIHPPTKGTILAHSTIHDEYLNNLHLPKGTSDHIKPVLNIERNYSISYPDNNNITEYRRTIGDTVSHFDPDLITCYTDGSKTSNGTGLGFHISTNNNLEIIAQHQERLPDYCTVYQAELLAIKEAAEAMSERTSCNITFLTDSMSGLQALEAITIKSNTALHCHNALSKLGTNNSVNLRWIPGHENHAGNESADKLANEATSLDTTTSGFIPMSHIKKAIKDHVNKMNQINSRTNMTSHVLQTIGHLNQENTKTLMKDLNNMKAKRADFRTATHIITGHAPLNYHLHKIGKTDSSICPTCNTDQETVEHLIAKCPALAQLRFQHLSQYYSNLPTIFSNNSISSIIRFCRESGRLNGEEVPHTSGVT